MASEVQIEGWAEDVNDLNDSEIRKLNQYLTGGISQKESGANSTIQALAADINGLTPTERLTFENKLNTASGGSKKSHFGC